MYLYICLYIYICQYINMCIHIYIHMYIHIYQAGGTWSRRALRGWRVPLSGPRGATPPSAAGSRPSHSTCPGPRSRLRKSEVISLFFIYIVVLQKSTPLQIRQLILHHH